MPSTEDFRLELRRQLMDAERRGAPSVDITSGELHRVVGDYPDSQRHRMKSCCEVMYAEQRSDDSVVSKPPKGYGASLTIRYRLPR